MRAGNARRHRCSTVTVGRGSVGRCRQLASARSAEDGEGCNPEWADELRAEPHARSPTACDCVARDGDRDLVGAGEADPRNARWRSRRDGDAWKCRDHADASSAPTSLFRISPPLRLSGPGPKADLNPPSLAISRRGMSPPGRHHLLAGTAVPRELPSHLLGRQWSTGPKLMAVDAAREARRQGLFEGRTFSRCVQGLSRRQGSPTSHQGRYTLGSDSRYRSCRKRPEPC